jgi:hypothetical protein
MEPRSLGIRTIERSTSRWQQWPYSVSEALVTIVANIASLLMSQESKIGRGPLLTVGSKWAHTFASYSNK